MSSASQDLDDCDRPAPGPPDSKSDMEQAFLSGQHAADCKQPNQFDP